MSESVKARVGHALAALHRAQPNGWDTCPGCGLLSMQYGQCILPGIGCGATKLSSMPAAVPLDAPLISGFGAPLVREPKPTIAPVDVAASPAKSKKAKRAASPRKGARARTEQGALIGDGGGLK